MPTISIRHDRLTPTAIAKSLANAGIFVWHGHNYAYEPTRFLKLPEDEGVIRIGLAHYNTEDEVARVVEAIDALAIRAGREQHLYQRPYCLTFIQSRSVIEVIRLGSVAKKFHAFAHLSRMSS